MARFDYVIVGAGFAGSVCAERLASAGKSILLIDQRPHVGGNAYDEHNEHGVLVHKYGPHIFHTNSSEVFEYLSRFTTWRPYEHRVRANVAGHLLPVPINATTLKHFGGDEIAATEAIIRPYTRKQWGCAPEALDPSVLARVKTREGTEERYFLDRFQCMPAFGYLPLFERMLASPRIDISLNHRGPTIYTDLAGIPLIYSGPIDQFFDYRFGHLPYRSAEFEFRTLDEPGCVQPVAVVNFPEEHIPFTRITEFKHLTGQVHPKTTLAREYPRAIGEPFWPVPKPENAALYRKYKELADATPGVHFVGRLGTYQYLNIDQVVAQALKLSRQLLGAIPEERTA